MDDPTLLRGWWSDEGVNPRRATAALLVLLGAVACSAGPAPAAAPVAPVAPTTVPSPAAGNKTLWLCRPGLPANPCEGGLDATVVDEVARVEPYVAATTPEVDCFYVYPTVSRSVSLNAPLEVRPELVAVARAQAARFGEVCRVFAPVYRQVTLSGIFTGKYDDPAARRTAEQDVLAAWRSYLAEDNDGRGVVLVGHSQGARTLIGLLDDTVEEQSPDLLVSALLLGGDVTVPTGEDVGGSFDTTPACREPGQTGCVVAYSAFGETPPPDALFGRTDEPGREVACTDPSRLAGGDGDLHPYLPTSELAGAGSLAATVSGLDTGFAAYPAQLTGSCERAAGVSYLQVQRAPGARLTAPDAKLGPRWGLHDGDVNLALGDLVEIVRRQARAYQAAGA